MMRIATLQRKSMLAGLLGLAVLGAGVSVMVQAAPAGQPDSTATEAHGQKQVQTQMKGIDAKISAARAHNVELQAQVAQMEQQNNDRQKQLQQRDAEITALQKKLQAAGVPASASSAVH